MNPISRLRSETFVGGAVTTVLPAVLTVLVQTGLISADAGTAIGGVISSLAGVLVLYGRQNGGQPLAPLKPLL